MNLNKISTVARMRVATIKPPINDNVLVNNSYKKKINQYKR